MKNENRAFGYGLQLSNGALLEVAFEEKRAALNFPIAYQRFAGDEGMTPVLVKDYASVSVVKVAITPFEWSKR